jgi:nicotinate phosphoribosyltransferase
MIIQSLLDTDLYKLTMQQAVLELYPDAIAEYRFTNRGNQVIGERTLNRLREELAALSEVKLLTSEIRFLETLDFLKPSYISYLSQYRFDPRQVIATIDDSRQLAITIKGPWRDTILWEVPLMALISEIYFEGSTDDISDMLPKAEVKAGRLSGKCHFADFGTRRRRSGSYHYEIVKQLAWTADTFVGTSNVKLALQQGLKPIGTMAHEWIMGISALEGLRHANRFALHKWKDVYKADLGIALTDTFGTAAFFEDFDLELAKVYDGVRHDSGDPIAFGESVIKYYEFLGIGPKSKTVVFSDGLNVDKALLIQEKFEGRIKTAYGIGTHLTNDFDTGALNMVIKLRSIDGIPVVKLSDEPGKETGAPDAIQVAKWTFGGELK